MWTSPLSHRHVLPPIQTRVSMPINGVRVDLEIRERFAVRRNTNASACFSRGTAYFDQSKGTFALGKFQRQCAPVRERGDCSCYLKREGTPSMILCKHRGEIAVSWPRSRGPGRGKSLRPSCAAQKILLILRRLPCHK